MVMSGFFSKGIVVKELKYRTLQSVRKLCTNVSKSAPKQSHSDGSVTTEHTESIDAVCNPSSSSSEVTTSPNGFPPPWENPWIYATGPPQPAPKFTGVTESRSEFRFVKRLLPLEFIPKVPKHSTYPTPSGWSPPKNPPPDLPYYVRRTRHHLFPLILQCRRDDLDPATLDYNYVELVILKMIEGDIFACDADLRAYLEDKLKKKVATHVNELQGKIFVKGADRSVIEQFLMDKGF